MSINGIPGSNIPSLVPSGPNATPSRRAEHRPATAGVPAESRPAGAPAEVARAAAGVPVHAPPGTDPELWSVLSVEERAFFAKVGAMGPLTYGRVLSGQVPTPTHDMRGGRLNVKV
jgi:hypothetical protein